MNMEQRYLQAAALDLAAEAHSLLQGKENKEVEGVSENVWQQEHAKVTEIKIMNQKGAKAMGRPIGSYITIDIPELRKDFTGYLLEPISAILAKELKKLLPPKTAQQQQPILVVGLGNFQTTPDALGPQTVAFTQPTYHFYQEAPMEEKKAISPLCAIAPGVVGNTGIETAEIIKGVADNINPCCLIIIDALAAASITRIGTTIQISNTGIKPGSGISNHRHAIDETYMGAPVIAIGMPTIVHAGMIINEAISNCCQNPNVCFSTKNQNIILETIDDLLKPFDGDLLVTPKEIDHLIPIAAKIIAAGIARASHPGATKNNYHLYLQ